MKHKVKAGTAHITKMAAIPFELKITRIMEEFLPMLLGMSLLYGESPCQYLNSLRLPYARMLILLLCKKGYIVGDVEDWTFRPEIVEKVGRRAMLQCPALRSRSLETHFDRHTPVSEPPVSLGALVMQYRNIIKETFQGPNRPKNLAFSVTNLAEMRQLCRKYDSRILRAKMFVFVQEALSSDQDATIEAFDLYLAKKGTKRL